MPTAKLEVPAVYLLQDQTGGRRNMGRELMATGYRVFQCASPREFFANYVYDVPGCLVLDLAIPSCNEQVCKELADRGLAPQIVYVSDSVNVVRASEATKREAADPTLKTARIENITAAVARAIARDAQGRIADLAKARLAELTASEREVLSHALKGGRNKSTAQALGIGIKTVTVRRKHLMRKLGISSVAELVQFAIEAGVQQTRLSPNDGHREKRMRRKGSRGQTASRSKGTSAVSRADAQKRFMAAAINELHALLLQGVEGQELAHAYVAVQFAGAIAPSARTILDGGRIDVAIALKALDVLEQELGEDYLQRFRHSVLRPRMRTRKPQLTTAI